MADAMPVKVKRDLYRGDARTWTHVIEDTATGDPIDVTDWIFTAQFRDDLNRGDVVAESVCSIFDGPGGIVVERLTGTEADKLPGQTDPDVKPVVYWDLQSVNGEGDPHTWKYAYCKVSGDSTNG